jgi:hypothetical protein
MSSTTSQSASGIVGRITSVPAGIDAITYSNGTIGLINRRPPPILTSGAVAGIAIGCFIAGALCAALFFLVQRRSSRTKQHYSEPNVNVDLPEVYDPSAEKSGFFNGGIAAKFKSRAKVSGAPTEGDSLAELSGDMSVRRKPLRKDIALPTRAELGEHDGLMSAPKLFSKHQQNYLGPRERIFKSWKHLQAQMENLVFRSNNEAFSPQQRFQLCLLAQQETMKPKNSTS